MAPVCDHENRAGRSTVRKIWLRFLETYRNLCISPSPEFLRTLAWMRDIQTILKPRQTSNV
jgi:hypothetical protein